MAITVYRALVQIPYRTGEDDDVANNVWFVQGVVGGQSRATDLEEITLALEDFYATPGTLPQRLTEFMSEVLDPTASRIKVYDLLDAKPRPALVDEVVDLGAPNTAIGLPQDCSAILNYRLQPISGTDRERTRGFKEIGPLAISTTGDTQTVAQSANLATIVAPRLRNVLMDVFERLCQNLALSNLRLVVFSEAAAGAEPWDINDLQNGSAFVEQGRVNPTFGTTRSRDIEVPLDSWQDVMS